MICHNCNKLIGNNEKFTIVNLSEGSQRVYHTNYDSQYLECAICKRATTKNHATQYYDIWICYWCDK